MTSTADTPALPELRPTTCAICETATDVDELYPASLDVTAFTPEVFSARRLPDQTHYRIVRCRRCGLVRSDPVLDFRVVVELYQASTFDYGEELEGLRATYGRALDRLAEAGPHRALAWSTSGAATASSWTVAQQRGWTGVRGVEPSADAVGKATDAVRPLIIEDVMRPGLFEPELAGCGDALPGARPHARSDWRLLRECPRDPAPGWSDPGVQSQRRRPGRRASARAQPDHRRRAHLSLLAGHHAQAVLQGGIRRIDCPASAQHLFRFLPRPSAPAARAGSSRRSSPGSAAPGWASAS